MRIIASHNPNDEIRSHSSAGGVFTQLAERVIADGGVVYGAGFNDRWHIEHQRVQTVSELALLRGSKYVFSDFLESIASTIKDLEDGYKVLYSGTPCQIAAIKKRVGNHDNLLLVEVVCHGAPDARFWEMYIDSLCKNLNRKRNEIKRIDFRDKRTGWKSYSFTISFRDGGIYTQRGGENLYMRAFLHDYTIRKACFKCPFKYPDGSKADITIGDFWGIDKIAPEIDNNLGTTVVIARTPGGVNAISKLNSLAELSLGEISTYNPAICTPANKPQRYEEFILKVDSTDDIISVFKKYAGIKATERITGIIKKILRRK